MTNCPHCGKGLPSRARTKASKAKVVTATAELATMTIDERFAHYHQTAPVEDVRFFLTHAVCSDTLKAEAAALLAQTDGYRLGMPRADWYRRLAGLHQRLRHEHDLVERWTPVAVALDRV